ncbi:hypothetical protein TanjilG_23468 [Lupinus angustifolius]|uniref:DUF241 domain protein n=1 Tax=Lupinus angustifolius TaxID=3871 RepID=A0A4P1R998_LUPAN|nr:PREDICTED: uncharacterized protein LOC109355470 [Lupinus angustifolius]OIW05682.1 hypothetical protein TanjilG_23468 [Lupinus angustifolius]
MAATLHQDRPKSLPSTPHPLILQCNQHLGNLEASVATSTSSSSSLFSRKLTGLLALHDCVEKLVLLPLTQQVIVKEGQEKWVDELLDGSLRLLDTCAVAKDALLHTKECARELQSIIRRKRGGEIEVTAEIKKFLASRKVVKKAILKALGNLKGTSKRGKFSPSNKDHQTVTLASMLKDVEVVTLSILESMLNFISGPAQSRSSNWSLVSKLMLNKNISCRQEQDPNEFTKVDAALQSFVFHVAGKSDNMNHLQNQLENLESVIQDFVEGLETLFKRFIKVRVSLLNILNH